MSTGQIKLPMNSDVNLLPGQSVRIESRPMRPIGVGIAFRPERIVIDEAADWVVDDVRCNGRSMIVKPEDASATIPGEIFSASAMDGFFSFDVVRAGEAFAMDVTYVGDAPEGAPFVCSVTGTVKIPGEATA